MTKRKVNLAYITNDAARKATFKKRKNGFIKKAHELSCLCAVDACTIIFSAYDNEPEVWPCPLGAQRVIARFRRLPDQEQTRKMVNQESFCRKMRVKMENQLRKQQKANQHKELINFMYRCLVGGGGYQHLSFVHLKDLGLLLNQNISDVDKGIKFRKKGDLSIKRPILGNEAILPIPFYTSGPRPSGARNNATNIRKR